MTQLGLSWCLLARGPAWCSACMGAPWAQLAVWQQREFRPADADRRSTARRQAPKVKTHTHTCTQAMHMQDSCTLALLCSGPPVGVGRASLRRFWKGKRPLGAATQCRESMATEPEVATRAQAARGPPHARTSERGSKRACHSSQQLASHPASQPASRPGSLVASCSGRSLVRRPLYLRKHRPIAHMTFPSHSRFAQSVCCFLQALKKHTLKH